MDLRIDRVRFVEYPVTVGRKRDQNDFDRDEIGRASLRAELWAGHRSPTSRHSWGRSDNPEWRQNYRSLAQRWRGDISCQIGSSSLAVLMRITKPFTPPFDAAVGGCGPVVLRPRSWDLGFATAPPSIVNAESDWIDHRAQPIRFALAARGERYLRAKKQQSRGS